MAISQTDQEAAVPSSSPRGWDGRRYKGAAFLAGAMAGMSMSIVMLILLLMGVTPRSLANLVSDKVAALAGPGIGEFFIQSIGALGKQMLFVFVLLGQVLVGGLLGLLFAFATGRTRRRKLVWRNSLIMSAAFWLLFVVAGFPLLDQGLLGAQLGNDQISTLVISFLLFMLFGLVLAYAYMLLVPAKGPRSVQTIAQEQDISLEQAEEVQQQGQRVVVTSRRRFVGLMSATFVLLVGAAIGTKAFGPSLTEYWATIGALRPDGSLEGAITPTPSFYQVSKNAFNPKVEAAGWQLEINGQVNQRVSFNLAKLQSLPQQKVYHTLTCISNPVGGQYIGNAEWAGIPLRDLLQQAGVKDGVKKVVFTCADGYKDSITIEKALEPNTMFVLTQNDEPLTPDHGFPGRMLIPDIYGMKNAKWVTQITLVDSEFKGYWQDQGWDNVATILTHSTIVSPPEGSTVQAGQVTGVKGFAYAGSRSIEKVEVSTDNGQTWATAKIEPRVGPNAWTVWRYEWSPPANTAKSYTLKVRATEQGGLLQTAERADSFPAGASGYHSVNVRSI